MKGIKSIKRFAAIIIAAGILGTAGAALAASPSEIVAGLTGKSAEQLTQERAAGKTYGTIAKDAGKLAEFKAAMLENRKSVLDAKVAEGAITREKADEIYNTMKERIADCDGTGEGQVRAGSGEGCLAGEGGAAMRFGSGSGTAQRQGAGNGTGTGGGAMRRGAGGGMARGSGTCTVTTPAATSAQ